jgi:hypothetical protein
LDTHRTDREILDIPVFLASNHRVTANIGRHGASRTAVVRVRRPLANRPRAFARLGRIGFVSKRRERSVSQIRRAALQNAQALRPLAADRGPQRR